MSALDQVCEDFVSSIATSSSSTRPTKRTRRASTPGATKSATAAMPERGRSAIIPVNSLEAQPAAQTSASGGADETICGPRPKAGASRRQKSRAAKSGASPALTSQLLQPDAGMSEPDQIMNDAGQSRLDSHRRTDRVYRTDLIDTGNPSDCVSAATIADPDCNVGGDDCAQPAVDFYTESSPVVAEIIALYGLRIQWLKAELRQVLQAQAICRQWTDGDKERAGKLYRQFVGGKVEDASLSAELAVALTPFLDGMRPYREQGALYEKRLAKAAKTLPAWAWAEQIWGFSAYGLAKIVGEAGNVGSYRNPSCLWKRLGLAVFDGKRQRRVTDAEEAALHGYSPQRRSMMWNVGNGLIGGMGLGVRPAVDEDWQARADWSPYQKIYVGRLLYEAERDPENMAREPTKLGKMSFSKHAHNRAKRYVEKRALRDLWSAWRAAERGHLASDSHLGSASLGSPFPLPMAAE